MARVLTSTEQLERGEFPPVCAVTGVDTYTLVAVPLIAMPRRTRWLIAAGVIPWLIVRLARGRTIAARIPISPEAESDGDRTTLRVGMLIGLIMAGVGVFFPHDLAQVGLVAGGVSLAAGFLAALLWGRPRFGLRLTATPWGGLVMSGAHARLRDAVAAGVVPITVRPVDEVVAEGAERLERRSIDPWAADPHATDPSA